MTAYYNEYDPKAAAWLRELIRQGLIAPGDVDERSIEDVRPADLAGYAQCHFFAGIGVWSYALRRAGWPDDRPVWTGSCPCQPFSAAGKGGGFDDERHLWPAFHWLIGQCRPPVVLGEQVASKDGLAWLDLVQADLEGSGYASGAVDTCAAGVGAPHIRQRLYWAGKRLADADDAGPQGRAFPAERAGERLAWASGVAGGLEHDESYGRLERGAEPSGRSVASGRGIGGLEHPNGAGQRTGQWNDPPPRHGATAATTRGIGGLAVPDDPERRADIPFGHDGGRPDAGRSKGAGHVGIGGSDGGLAEPDGAGRIARERDDTGARHGHSASSAGNHDRHEPAGPTNGLWRDADWLFCRDGKWRPVEPKPQPLVDGVAQSLGRVCADRQRELEFDIAEWAQGHQVDAGKAMHDLRCTLLSDAQRERPTGRLPDLYEAPFLLAFLRQLEEQGWAFAERISGESAEIAEARMRMLRDGQEASCAPCERGLDGQSTGECPDPMRVLSSILAFHASEAWRDAYDAYAPVGFPLEHGARARVARLRGYGNAIVAPAAQAFIEAYLETEADRHLRLTGVPTMANDEVDIFA